MIFPRGAARRTNHTAASEQFYDAIIVGSGISGAIIANELSQAGKRVLILEAGPGDDLTLQGYEDYLTRFYAARSSTTRLPSRTIRTRRCPRASTPARCAPGSRPPPATSPRPVRSAPTPPTPECSAGRRCTGRARRCGWSRTTSRRTPVRPGTGLADRLPGPDAVLQPGRARDRGVGRRRGPVVSGDRLRPRLCVPDEGPAAVLPGQDGGAGRRRHDGRARRRAVRAEGQGVPAGAQRDPEPGL